MTKAELIEEVAKQAECSKADAERTLTAFFDLVVASTKKGEKVAWPGFRLVQHHRSQRTDGRNPQTGAAVNGSRLHCDEVHSELNIKKLS